MGYTHYWKVPKELDENKYVSFLKDVRKIVQSRASILDVTWMDHETLSVNGIGEDSHEDALFSRRADSFQFCKTARKPYDEVVVAILCCAKFWFGEAVKLRSDGRWESWETGFSHFGLTTGHSAESLLGTMEAVKSDLLNRG